MLLGWVLLVTICTPVQAETFIADTLHRNLPPASFAIKAGNYKKHPILPGNSDKTGGLLMIKFKESRGYYGFSAMICDADNTDRYETNRKANCYRQNIDLETDILKYKFEGDQAYYLFIINKTIPVNIDRSIAIEAQAFTQLTPDQRDATKNYIALLNETLAAYFKSAPFNVALVPCQSKVIPSSEATRTLTICSEFALENGIALDNDLLRATFLYEAAPFLAKDWGEDKKLQTEQDRLQLMAALMMIFSETIDPFKKYLTLHAENPDLERIISQIPAHGGTEATLSERLAIMNDIYVQPFAQIDRWLNISYDHMTSATLEKIKSGELHHYGYLRNAARLILKQRFETANPSEFQEEDNIISDFW